MKVTGIKCGKCNQIIYSRHRHDYHYCHCNNVAIDGGRDYTKVTGDMFTLVEIDVNATEAELEKDYAKGGNKYGWIYEEEK